MTKSMFACSFRRGPKSAAAVKIPLCRMGQTDMYRKRFTFDPKQIERARLVTLRSPNLNVLSEENRSKLPGLAHFLEQGFKARDADGKLLLPNLSALANRTVGIFSDYGGEDQSSHFFTYSFMVCAFGSLDPFKQKMASLRAKSGLGKKEIAFKDFRYGPLRRMLPDYLRLCDSYINGLLFTLVIDKTIPSLFGPNEAEPIRHIADALDQNGYGTIAPQAGEKLFRILHCIAYLLALLGQPGQKIFWMTDHDAIGETPEKHTKLLEVLYRVLPLYTTKPFSRLGGARPFTPKAFEFLDLLSTADIAAGTIAQVLTSMETLGEDKAQIKEGGDKVLRWLCYDSMTLKKLALIVRRMPNGEVGCGPIDFEAKTHGENEIFIPMELFR
ncbi:hypothetical protein [Rhizobium sp. ZPR3]|uniref:DUF3800 domain-containing protein n=2 Tax=unclassified Rhizobium TaxID=2613769 RepID=A0AAU7SQ60_9HYPH